MVAIQIKSIQVCYITNIDNHLFILIVLFEQKKISCQRLSQGITLVKPIGFLIPKLY
jgi:hypothetical protein